MEWFQQHGCNVVKLNSEKIQPGLAAEIGDTVWDWEKYKFLHDTVVKFNGK